MLMQFVNCIWCSDAVCEVHFQIVGDAVAVHSTSRKPGQRNVYKDVLYLTHTMLQKTFEILEIWVHGSRYYGVTSILLKEYSGVLSFVIGVLRSTTGNIAFCR